ncbi:deoxyribonuclease [Prescottella equi]|uniref:DUF1524 domain-containing protein n=1 Tax=Rhodococcus hoagii TaxID=43767 RepID=A0AAE5CIM0_RHOHA|nr:DUF1524 domain-containing protein [Prescottella equi]NKR53551.1 DUF1524 domain-containing protein [Prescottella equi]NKS29002.1 DUF1524 domain-containing protein [Prescottella equi]ORL33655.1 deoxyribonuclease [Prescottella equi]ORL87613.1 deoxyribonuclease [Prescottella equi]ORM13298.1 deoxyribonuclease [Prescottella equi]
MSAVKIDKSWVAGFATVAVLFAGGCTAIAQPSSGSATDAEPGSSATAQVTGEQTVGEPAVDPVVADGALAGLAALPIRERAPKNGYDRSQFGQAWTDNVTIEGGHNGCDTRNDILKRDLIYITTDPMSRDCTVLSGTLDDVYTGKTIRFVRGVETSSAVQIDHVVALSDAWQKGAQQLDEATRRNLANDPRNLQAVDGPTNQGKSDADASAWLPPNLAYRCTYVTRQIEVKAAYGLWVTQAEHDAMARELSSCGATESADPAPIPVPEPADVSPAGAGMPSGDVYYANCKAARIAGAAPLHRGQPGYRAAMDSDGDGVACE